MSDFVGLLWKRNRGWPWPEKSFGLTPMFGEDGWCRSCGVPSREQLGSLILQRKGTFGGAWVPNWLFDVFCVDDELARRVRDRFAMSLRPVEWHRDTPVVAFQIDTPTVGPDWFDPAVLEAAVVAKHGRAGNECPECGVWRWFPLAVSSIPELRLPPPSWANHDVVASPEWFGDGLKAFRQVLFRRELAELVVETSPRDFAISEVNFAQ